jgi:hypothetical protein
MQQNLIPTQEAGAETNTESIATFSSSAEADAFFAIARQRVFSVHNWKSIAGGGASFRRTDAKGNDLKNGQPEPGEFICIDIPAPGPAAGDGHDWVQIEKVSDADDHAGMTVHPSPSPENKKEEVAHFFDSEASSTFLVRKEDNKVIAGVYGRNEKPNTKADGVVDTIRNVAVAAGALSGFSKIQWKNLVNGFVQTGK